VKTGIDPTTTSYIQNVCTVELTNKLMLIDDNHLWNTLIGDDDSASVRTPMGRVYESEGLKRWTVPTRPKDHDSRLR
jgi:hypothetical protein